MNEKTHSRYDTARKILIFWTLFICIGAVGGAAMMLLDPSGKSIGMDAMLPYFQVLPFADVVFRDFTFSGWALLIVNGLTNLTAAVLLLRKNRMGAVLGGIFGVTLRILPAHSRQKALIGPQGVNTQMGEQMVTCSKLSSSGSAGSMGISQRCMP